MSEPMRFALTADIARAAWQYRDGFLYRTTYRTAKKSRAGMIAGAISSTGYRHVSLNGRDYLAHRIVWLIHYGTWPEKNIDHINGDRDDNRIENLREASVAENGQAGHLMRRHNKSGYRGVHRSTSGKKWVSQITVFGVTKHLGTFESKEDAAAVYLSASEQYSGEFCYRRAG